MPRPRREADLSTYQGRVAARLNELVLKRGWSNQQVADMLGIEEPTLRTYLRGDRVLPLNLVPSIAKAFGYGTAHGWLPEA
jgi:transcriptional regulator with XRE-family HTH domain